MIPDVDLVDHGPWCSDCSTAEAARTAAICLGQSLPELALFQDETPQMPSASVGKAGYLRLAFEPDADRTQLVDLDRRVPMLAQKALYWDESAPDMACVTTITTSGCVIQGDRMALDVRLAPRSRVLLTTQSATKVHCMEHNFALQLQRFTLGEDSYMEYLPDPLILHRTTRYVLDTQIVLPPSASLLYGEIMVPGRRFHHPDELFGFDVYSASMMAARTPHAPPLFADHFLLEPHRWRTAACSVPPFRNPGVMGSHEIFGSMLLLAPEQHLLPLRNAIGADATPNLAWGAALLPNKCGLLLKVLGLTTESVRAKMREFHCLTRVAITGTPPPDEFLWK